jgi:hypothetical protein
VGEWKKAFIRKLTPHEGLFLKGMGFFIFKRKQKE